LQDSGLTQAANRKRPTTQCSTLATRVSHGWPSTPPGIGGNAALAFGPGGVRAPPKRWQGFAKSLTAPDDGAMTIPEITGFQMKFIQCILEFL
jgi:hypothetical protein